jgi:hypothetical protein
VDPSGHFIEIIVGAIIGAILGATVSAVTGGDIALGALTGAISGGYMGGASIAAAGLNGVVKAAVYARFMAEAGAINAAISGSDIGKGALFGGAFGAAVGAMPTDLSLLKPFPKTGLGTVGNRLFGSAVMGAAIGAAEAGMTGGDVGYAAGMGAATWAASQAFFMGAAHIQGRLATGHWYDEFNSNTENWYYYQKGGHPANYGGGVVMGDYDWIWDPQKFGYPPAFQVSKHESGHNWQDMFSGPANYLTVSAGNYFSYVWTKIVGAGAYDPWHSYNPWETTWMPYHAGGY